MDVCYTNTVARQEIGTGKRRTTIWLADVDREAIRRIRERWRLDTDSAAIRFAIHVLAQAERLEVVVPPDFDVEEVKEDV